MSQSSRCQTLLQHWKIPKKFIIKIFESVHSRQIVHSLWILLVQFQIIPAPGSLLFHGTQTSQHQCVSVGAAVQRNKYLKIKWCRWVSSWKLRWTIQMNRYCRKNRFKHTGFGTNQPPTQPAGKWDGTDILQHASTLQLLEQKGEAKIMAFCLHCS